VNVHRVNGPQEAEVFFAKYDRFLDTSETAAHPLRLKLRHRAIIRDNLEIFDGARVLDIASHDGRWSFAAQHAGAAHTTGIEARAELVDNAVCNFEHYGIPADQFRFVQGDVVDVLSAPDHGIKADVVMCLGFLYHTIRYPEIFMGIRSVKPEYLLVDTAVWPSDQNVIKIYTENVEIQSQAAGGALAFDGRMLVGRPSAPALEFMLKSYGFEVVKRFDWQGLLADRAHVGPVSTYANGRRITWLCRSS
jgi:SAM-dependent methyltransferase